MSDDAVRCCSAESLLLCLSDFGVGFDVPPGSDIVALAELLQLLARQSEQICFTVAVEHGVDQNAARYNRDATGDSRSCQSRRTKMRADDGSSSTAVACRRRCATTDVMMCECRGRQWLRGHCSSETASRRRTTDRGGAAGDGACWCISRSQQPPPLSHATAINSCFVLLCFDCLSRQLCDIRCIEHRAALRG